MGEGKIRILPRVVTPTNTTWHFYYLLLYYFPYYFFTSPDCKRSWCSSCLPWCSVGLPWSTSCSTSSFHQARQSLHHFPRYHPLAGLCLRCWSGLLNCLPLALVQAQKSCPRLLIAVCSGHHFGHSMYWPARLTEPGFPEPTFVRQSNWIHAFSIQSKQ